MNKAELRKQVKAAKAMLKACDKNSQAQQVFSTIEALPQFLMATHILLYSSLPDELPTHDVLIRWCHSKRLYLPRVNGSELEVAALSGPLDAGNRFHIPEPQGPAISPAVLQLAIVPAVALDSHCNRLGRGRGYYDRLLRGCPALFTIGVGFDCQFFDTIPFDNGDVPLRAVVTPAHTCMNQ